MLDILKRAATIIAKGGDPNYTDLAEQLGAPRPALYLWKQVPAAYVLKLEEITDGELMRWEIREDLWPKKDFVGKHRIFEVRERA